LPSQPSQRFQPTSLAGTNQEKLPALASSSSRQSRQTSTVKPLVPTAKAFVERQYKLYERTLEGKRHDASKTADLVRDMRNSTRTNFLGAQGVKGFQIFLKRKFGSIVAGWRELDTHGYGRLTRGEFILACGRVGFHGDIKYLWQQLDHKGSGVIGLIEIDHICGFLVGEFKMKLLKIYGDMLTAWREGLDLNHSGHVSQKELSECLQRLGLDHLDCELLYKALLCQPQKRLGRAEPVGLTLQQFDPEAAVKARTQKDVWIKKGVTEDDDDWEFRAMKPSKSIPMLIAELQEFEDDGKFRPTSSEALFKTVERRTIEDKRERVGASSI